MATTVTNKMLYMQNKLRSRLSEISGYRYRDVIQLEELKVCDDLTRNTVEYPPSDADWKIVKIGDNWKGRDKYLWVTFDIDIPKNWQDKKILGFLNFGITGGGTNSGFESLAFLNGKPYQGVDTNHKELFLPQSVAGQKIDLSLRLWSGLEGGGIPHDMEHKFSTAFFCWLDEKIDDLFFTTKAALDTISQLPDNDINAVKLISLLDRAFYHVDWTVSKLEDKNQFYSSLHKAQEVLRNGILELNKNSDVTINCIGHTHIDVAWLWRIKHTREKCVRSFSTVLRLMEMYPDYVFLQSQPQLYDYIKQDYPEVYKNIKARVDEGRWEVNGAMWVEADCNLTSGESLVRQILFGKKFFKEEFNIDADYLWLPDVFGYSWALPQILKKSGVNTFMTSKISWNQYNKIPHDTFMWRGMDGTEILTHMITTPGVHASKDSWFYTYNGEIHANTIDETWNRYVDKDINNELLISYGHGDGGGGVERAMLEMRSRLDEMPSIPNVKTQTASDFFKGLHERVEDTDRYVHKWDGELYLEYHRGTYTTQALIKKLNRKLENLYREVEILAVFTKLINHNWNHYDQELMEKGWKMILTNQFHDIIPGSSITEVYKDAVIDYTEVEKYARNINENNHSIIKTKDHCYSVFNQTNWKRNDVVWVDNNEDVEFVDEKGDQLKSQKVDNGWLVYLSNMKPLAYTTFNMINKVDNENTSPFTISNSKIDTPFYTIDLNEFGHFSRIFDKEASRDVLVEGKSGNVIQTFEDRPMAHDAWDIDIYYQDKMYEVKNLKKFEILENGNIRAVIRLEYEHLNSYITQDIIFYAHTKRIDFKTHVNWQERRHLMKVAFPVEIRSTKATYDVQFGNVERPTHWNTSWDWARFEVVGHKWADLSEGGYGVSLLNDCKYGYDIKDQTIRLTLLKGATYPDPYADLGEHDFTYSLFPHTNDWKDAETEKEAYILNNPLTSVMGEVNNQSLFKFSDTNIVVDAIKKAEYSDDIIIRFHEYKGMRKPIEIRSDYLIKSWQEVDLMENPISDEISKDHVNVLVKPYEIKTFKIKF